MNLTSKTNLAADYPSVSRTNQTSLDLRSPEDDGRVLSTNLTIKAIDDLNKNETFRGTNLNSTHLLELSPGPNVIKLFTAKI
jgi:hypothetical protein